MTPRQLMKLANQHREFEGGTSRGGQQVVQDRRPKQESTQGSAGWLLAVADNLNRHKPAPRGE